MYCGSRRVKRNGRFRGKQGYKCKNCSKQFVSRKRVIRIQRILWKKYIWQRQTLNQLAKEYQKSNRWIQKQLDQAPLNEHRVNPQPIIAVSDVTFFGRGYGILVVRCPKLKRNLYWKEVMAETPEEYWRARKKLEERGYIIQGAVVDGKRGITAIFRDIPVQICANSIKSLS